MMIVYYVKDDILIKLLSYVIIQQDYTFIIIVYDVEDDVRVFIKFLPQVIIKQNLLHNHCLQR